MKPFLLILTIIFVTLCCSCPLSAKEQQMVITPDMQFSYADSLYTAKDHETARVEFKRFVHFFPTDERLQEAEFKIAMCLYLQQHYHDAAKAFNQIILQQKETPFTQESYFLQARAFMEMGNTGYAQVVLQNFLKLTEDVDTKDKIYQELARIHISTSANLDTNTLETAQNYLSLISPGNAEHFGVDRQHKTLEQAQTAPQKNPVLSGIFSIIPGGGFLYCGRYKDALVSFCLNAGLMVAAYEAFDNDNTALGGVITFVETGFYTGNIHGAITAAHKYNKAQKITILNREFSLGSTLDLTNNGLGFSLNHPF
ncbi:MAG: tetratricopeptide repeat protein [Proteobacteria bacterium]|nr:tetratricopeptide repeat protein [Desulfobacula sp.]MBU3951283.1 tetratricopeptide repeat protein [Pseudomonadota bacterium]MBU4131263.1 tetratricopeptide repeat protein [Pseudomonadota bacterium]